MCTDGVLHSCPATHTQANTVKSGFPALVDPEGFINLRDLLWLTVPSAESSTDSKISAFNYWCLCGLFADYVYTMLREWR
jgi:hypothetical protein